MKSITIDGVTYKTITAAADALGAAEGTLRQRQFRAEEKLAKANAERAAWEAMSWFERNTILHEKVWRLAREESTPKRRNKIHFYNFQMLWNHMPHLDSDSQIRAKETLDKLYAQIRDDDLLAELEALTGYSVSHVPTTAEMNRKIAAHALLLITDMEDVDIAHNKGDLQRASQLEDNIQKHVEKLIDLKKYYQEVA